MTLTEVLLGSSKTPFHPLNINFVLIGIQLLTTVTRTCAYIQTLKTSFFTPFDGWV